MPNAMGCTVVHWGKMGDISEQYKILLRLSQNAHIPRYQMQVINKDKKVLDWVVGHMYKPETHLRTKPGEFIRVNVWELTCNGMRRVRRRNSLNRQSSIFGSAVQ